MGKKIFVRATAGAALIWAAAIGAVEGYDAYDRAAGYGVETLEKRVEKLERKLAGPALTGISQDVDKLQSEVLRLRGELEKATNEINRVKKVHKDDLAAFEERLQQFSKAQGDLQAQLQTLAPQNAEVPGTTPAVPGDPNAAPAVPPADPNAAAAGAVAPPAPAGTPTTPPGTSAAVPPPAPQEPPPIAQREAAYQKAFTTLKEGRYPDAIRELKGFLSAYPTGDYSDNAQYWLAEAYYVTKDPAAARTAFDSVIKNYPQSSKAADALLKLGFIDYDIGQYEQARATLNEVIKSYPNSSAAKLAEKRLDKMRQENR